MTARIFRNSIAPAFLFAAAAFLATSPASAKLVDGQTALGITSDREPVTVLIQQGQEVLHIGRGGKWHNASGMWLNVKFTETAPGSWAAYLSNGWMKYQGGRLTP